MKKLLWVGVVLGVLSLAGCGTETSGSQPTPSSHSAHSVTPTAIRFDPTHPRHGWLWAHTGRTNILFHTIDAGFHWQVVWRSRRILPRGIPRFLSSRQGWMAALMGQHVTLLATTDGGRRWHAQTLGTQMLLYSVGFPTENLSHLHWLMAEGYPTLGANTVVLYQYETPHHRWEPILPMGLPGAPSKPTATLVASITGFTIQNEQTAWVGTSGNGVAGGLDRVQIRHDHAIVRVVSLPGLSPHSPSDRGIEPPVFHDLKGVVVGRVSATGTRVTGPVWTTDNGGATWKKTAQLPQSATQARFVTPRVGFAWTQTQWWSTTNSGRSWVLRARLPGQIQTVDIVNPRNIWVLTASGLSSFGLYHSRDEGQRWTAHALPSLAPSS